MNISRFPKGRVYLLQKVLWDWILVRNECITICNLLPAQWRTPLFFIKSSTVPLKASHKSLIVFKLSETCIKMSKILRIPNWCLFYSLASEAPRLLAILQCFTKKKFQSISMTRLAALWQKLAADVCSLSCFYRVYFHHVCTFIRRSTVLTVPLQSLFPCLTYCHTYTVTF